MNACIYARTCRNERRHHTTTIENQIAFGMELARKHNLTVRENHIFTDVELAGSLPPTCWADENEAARPALSAMLEAIEEGEISRIIVRRFEKLGTSSEILVALRDSLATHDVRIIASQDQIADDPDPSGQFALSLLKQLVQFDTEAERERKDRLRDKKLDEINRLHARIDRLEAEVSDLE